MRAETKLPEADLFTLFDQLCEARKMSSEEAGNIVKTSLSSAVRRKFGETARCDVTFEPDKKVLSVVRLMRVVDEVVDPASEISLEDAQHEDPEFQAGEELEIPLDPKTMGRYASYAGRDAIRRDTRAHVRGELLERWQARVGTLVMVQVQSVEHGTAYCTIPGEAGVEVVLPSRQQDRDKPAREGDSVEVAILEAREDKGVIRVVVTESGAQLVLAEIRDRVPADSWAKINIINAVREAGRCTKIMVEPRPEWPDFDAIRALAGPMGALIKRVADELDERIDLIPATDDALDLAQLALAPAHIESVEFDEEKKEIVAYVNDSQARREAIGEKGSNVRLAGQLAGYTIRIEGGQGARR